MSLIQKPFTDFKQIISLFYLFFNSHGFDNIEEITVSIQSLFNLNLNESQIKNYIENYFFIFGINQCDIVQLLNNLKNELKKYKNVLTVPFNNCIKCHKELEYCKHYNATIYYIKGPKLSTIKVKKCSECNILYDLDKFIDANEKFFYSKKINYEFFMTSSETGFSKKIFQQCNEYLIRNGFSFSAFSDSYNELFAKTAVRPLQRQRLVECWFQAKILHIENQLSDNHIPYFNCKQTETCIANNFDNYKQFMIKKWSQQHKVTCKNSICHKISNFF